MVLTFLLPTRQEYKESVNHKTFSCQISTGMKQADAHTCLVVHVHPRGINTCTEAFMTN